MNFTRIPRGPLALLCALLALSALPGCSRGPRWTDLLDEDLSAWRIWQSYATPEEGFQGRLPLGEDGNPLPAIGYDKKPFVIENEAWNSSHTGNEGATDQGFAATVLNCAPLLWPLGKDGYKFDKDCLTPLVDAPKDIPVMTVDKL